jgi:hypothetical protein
MPTSFDWKFIFSLLAALAGVLVPVWLWQVELSARSIAVRLVSSVALQPETTSTIPDLQISVDGVKLESPYLSTLELVNSGTKPIPSSDFESPIELLVYEGAQIVRARIASTRPTDVHGEITIDKQSVKLQPLLLNSKDSLTFAVITSGNAPTFASRARIAGISKIAFEDVTRKKLDWNTAAVLLPVALISFVMYMVFLVALIRPTAVTLVRPISVLVMLSCAIASALSLRRASEALQIEQGSYHVWVFLVIASAVAVPISLRLLRKSRTVGRKSAAPSAEC